MPSCSWTSARLARGQLARNQAMALFAPRWLCSLPLLLPSPVLSCVCVPRYFSSYLSLSCSTAVIYSHGGKLHYPFQRGLDHNVYLHKLYTASHVVPP